ncbi:MAG: type transport system permease protein [Tepidanaerobacteraceae bacterium]|nr:type transport system permease protein [Tepidanaerobacteraceae bacterium]
MGILTVLWQEYIFFKRKFWSITFSNMISPTLYLIAFGWGIGSEIKVGGKDYIAFIVPGIIALTTMTTSFSSAAYSINIAKIYEKTLEEFVIAPISPLEFTFGKILASAFRGMYSAVLILLLAFLFKTNIKVNGCFMLVAMLNCLVFAALGFTSGLVVTSHEDMGKFNNFIITPMAFLCGTFFPIEKMPYLLKQIILFLPLTHTTQGLRNINYGYSIVMHILVLIIYLLIFAAIGIKVYRKTE